jgi:hypothetical protein
MTHNCLHTPIFTQVWFPALLPQVLCTTPMGMLPQVLLPQVLCTTPMGMLPQVLLPQVLCTTPMGMVPRVVTAGVVHHTNGNATGTTTSPQQHNAAQSAAQTTSQQPAARDGQQSHGGADAGGSGDGGGDDNQHRGSATTTANATAQPTKLPSLEDIIGVGDSAMLSLLGVKYESLSQVQQRSHAWHQARVVRITASDVPAITGVCPSH